MKRTTPLKRTAANSHLLAATKKVFNGKIFKHASRIMNEEGMEATLKYLGKFFLGGTVTLEKLQDMAQYH